jgi:hypothetical protein
MRKPISFTFKVIKQKAIDFSFISRKEMLQYPIFEHYLREVQETLVVYEFIPGANFDKEKYKQLIMKKLKTKYNAYSVVFIGNKIKETTLQQ